MSKTTEVQIEKSRNLIEGLRRHVREMGERGISNTEINEMEKTVAMLTDAIKASYAESKKTLKGYYPQERWPDYGIPDKR